MQKMFLRLLTLCFICGSAYVYGADDTVHQKPLVISNSPEYIARSIFTGPDGEMPFDGRWRMSISPNIEGGQIAIPGDLHEAFLELREALPKWYQAALYRSRGSLECFVLINNLELHIDVMNWLWVNWRLEEPDSELRTILEGMGAEHRDQVLFGIHDGFCFYLKYGEEKAMELLTAPADEDEEERVLPPLDAYSGEREH